MLWTPNYFHPTASFLFPETTPTPNACFRLLLRPPHSGTNRHPPPVVLTPIIHRRGLSPTHPSYNQTGSVLTSNLGSRRAEIKNEARGRSGEPGLVGGAWLVLEGGLGAGRASGPREALFCRSWKTKERDCERGDSSVYSFKS